MLDAWTQQHKYGFSQERQREDKLWIMLKHVETVIRYSNNSAPGPDGIPYLAWRCVEHFAAVVLHAAANQIQSEGSGSTLGRGLKSVTCDPAIYNIGETAPGTHTHMNT